MRCKNCGFENEDGRYICSNCGSPLYDEDEIMENDINDDDNIDDYNNMSPDDEDDGNKKQIVTIIIAVIVVVAVVAGIVFGAVSGKNNKETTTESTSASTTKETTTKRETTTKEETTTEEPTTEETTKETTTAPTTTTEKTFRVYVDIDGNGDVSGDGEYAQNKKAVLTATPNSGFEFDGWYDSNGNLVASGSKYTITVKGDVTLTAKFKAVDGGIQ